jgi:DNA-directed RNA polymerase specialized sigma24 family protein
MQLTQAFEDREVRRQLLGEGEELEAAFAQVDAHLRSRFVKGARERLPGLAPEDLADAWQETLKELLQTVRTGRFDPDRELGPWLWTTFVRNAVDGVRRRERFEGMLVRARNRVDLLMMGDILEEIDEEERKALLAEVRGAAGSLPARQRMVLRIFIDRYPATTDGGILREEVSRVTGREETPTSVRRALQEACRKVGAAVRARLV